MTKLMELIPGIYCGTEKSNHKVTKNCLEGYDHNGIDRIDSSKNYTIANVAPCCKICNYAKSDMTQKNLFYGFKKQLLILKLWLNNGQVSTHNKYYEKVGEVEE